MANSKISALPSATTPLAGTETLPIVQSSATRQVSVANLTAGRAISASGVTVTGLTASKPVFTDGSSNLTSSGTVPTNQGGTGLTSFTANGVVYASSTSALATGNGFVFDGANAGVNVPSPGKRLDVDGQFRVRNGAASGYALIEYGVSATATNNWHVGSEGDGTFRWYNGNFGAGTLRLSIDSSGNLIFATAAKGVNFTANTPAAGMTSQLLNWYEEGTWTPTDQSGAGLSFTITDNKYTRTGRLVQVNALITWPTTASTGNVTLGGLPFTCGNYSLGQIVGFFGVSGCVTIPSGGTLFYFRDLTGNLLQNSAFSGKDVAVSVCYMV